MQIPSPKPGNYFYEVITITRSFDAWRSLGYDSIIAHDEVDRNYLAFFDFHLFVYPFA